MTNETDSVIDGLIVDELTHVLLCDHWISPFIFDGEFSVDARGQVTELRQKVDDGPGINERWQDVKRDTQLWWALTEAIEREYKDRINEALRERAFERFVARPKKWGDAVPL
jgi:hypothetical protein